MELAIGIAQGGQHLFRLILRSPQSNETDCDPEQVRDRSLLAGESEGVLEYPVDLEVRPRAGPPCQPASLDAQAFWDHPEVPPAFRRFQCTFGNGKRFGHF